MHEPRAVTANWRRFTSGNVTPLISLVIPCFNEESCFPELKKHLQALFESRPDLRFEVILIDDGSSDDTIGQALKLIREDSRFSLLELSRNFGKEYALSAGIDHSSGDAVIPFDADMQDPPELIPTLVDEWIKGHEVVLGKRVDRQFDTFGKRFTARLFYRLHNALSRVKIPENVGDFRLMDRRVVDAIKSLPERQRFMKGLFAWVGFRTKTIEYARPPRYSGNTKFSFWSLWNFALEGITSFSTAPLKIWTYIGAIIAASCLLYGAVIIAKVLIYGSDVPGYASIFVAVVFLGSLQLIGIGILGEYVGRTYLESKDRPLYIVRKRHCNDDWPDD